MFLILKNLEFICSLSCKTFNNFLHTWNEMASLRETLGLVSSSFSSNTSWTKCYFPQGKILSVLETNVGQLMIFDALLALIWESWLVRGGKILAFDPIFNKISSNVLG